MEAVDRLAYWILGMWLFVTARTEILIQKRVEAAEACCSVYSTHSNC